MRGTTADASRQIAENPGLTADQKKQALAALATATREQVRATLGAKGADAYFKNSGMRWLKEIEKGNTVKFSTEDENWSSICPPKEPKPAKPANAKLLAYPVTSRLTQAKINNLSLCPMAPSISLD